MSVLLSGSPKTGNTWLRFVIFHYLNMIEKHEYRTLTHRDLAWLKDNEMRVQHTHIPHSGENAPQFYDKFNKMIYIWRNPYDTMISYHEYLKNRDVPFNILRHNLKKETIEKLHSLEGFTGFFLEKYIDHINSTRSRADLVLCYDDLRKNTKGFYDALKMVCRTLKLSYREHIAKKAIRMSSFENIKQMGIDTNQKGGLAIGYKGSFCRDGTVGQYKKVMSKELINYITERWNI